MSLAIRLNQWQADVKDPQELKSRLLSEITKSKENNPTSTTAALADGRLFSAKNSIKGFLSSSPGVLRLHFQYWLDDEVAERAGGDC